VIALDSSSLVAYLAGASGADIDLLDRALADATAVLPAPVLTDILAARNLDPDLESTFLQLPLLAITEGYWERAGRLRRGVLAGKRKARLADTLISQNCIDNDVPLIARDQGFRHFVPAGLRLLP
jgi:predicted nucleic acid-binding protein